MKWQVWLVIGEAVQLQQKMVPKWVIVPGSFVCPGSSLCCVLDAEAIAECVLLLRTMFMASPSLECEAAC